MMTLPSKFGNTRPDTRLADIRSQEEVAVVEDDSRKPQAEDSRKPQADKRKPPVPPAG
jgi:hypothetical protein